MRLFLRHIIAGSLIVLSMFACLELVLLECSNEYSYKREFIEKHISEINILILGHSHSEDGINPSVFNDNAFNFAIEGRPLYYDVKLAEKYIPKMKNLKYCIMPLGYNFEFVNDSISWWEMRKDPTNLTYACMYFKYMGIEPVNKSVLYWPEVLNSNMKYFTRLYSKNFNILVGCDSLGFRHRRKEDRSDSWDKNLMIDNRDDKEIERNQTYIKGLNYFKRIAKVCDENDVKLIITTLPCYETYITRTTLKGRNMMNQFIIDLQSSYPSVKYKNYLFDNRFDENDFYNASHLNESGAEKFTKILINDFFI